MFRLLLFEVVPKGMQKEAAVRYKCQWKVHEEFCMKFMHIRDTRLYLLHSTHIGQGYKYGNNIQIRDPLSQGKAVISMS